VNFVKKGTEKKPCHGRDVDVRAWDLKKRRAGLRRKQRKTGFLGKKGMQARGEIRGRERKVQKEKRGDSFHLKNIGRPNSAL